MFVTDDKTTLEPKCDQIIKNKIPYAFENGKCNTKIPTIPVECRHALLMDTIPYSTGNPDET